jgi:phenol hydroxylase P1 protein
MQIDIKAKEVKPIRHTYSHISRRFGEDRVATRYQEAVLDLQPVDNFHYRPTWQPEKELYDPTRTAIVMEDWYSFLDPRQYYYGTYTMARAKQQASADQNFKFVEKRNLLAQISAETQQTILDFVVPLRHYEWGANMNNYQICAMGYGAAITSAAAMHGSDRLGNAQYITRIALALTENDTSVIDTALADWMEKDVWQGLRKLVEDSLVVEDWFELFVAQNLVMDGLIMPLFFEKLEADLVAAGGATYAMLTEFIVDWNSESIRWVDKQVSVAIAESPENEALVNGWFENWLGQAQTAIAPLADALFDDGPGAMADITQGLKARAVKAGVTA